MPCTTWPVDARRRRLLRGVAASAAAFWGSVAPLARAQRAGPGRTLTVALVPYLSARAMLAQFEPMRAHLESALGRPVEFFTASSFAALLESVRTGQQPFTLLPMHLARIAVADWGHMLVARSTLQSPVELIAPRSLRLEGAASLRGRRLAVFDPWSLTTLMVRRWLQAQRLNGAVQLVAVPSISASAAALARGEVDAMVAAHGQSVDVPWLKPDELSVVATIGQVHSPCFVAQRGLAAAHVAAFRAALLGFVAPAGRTGASGAQYVEGSAQDLEPYEPYAAEVRRMLAESPRPPRN